MTAIEELIAQATKRIAPCRVLSLYARGGTDEVRDGIVATYEDYVSRWGSHLSWFAEDETGRFREFDEQVAQYPRRALERQTDLDVRWVTFGGEHHRDASAWKFKGTLHTEAPRSFLDISSASWAPHEPGPTPAEILELALDWARRFPVYHGYAGYALGVAELNVQPMAKTIYDLAMRFQGLEIHDPRSTSLCCLGRIKGVNWLTLVSNVLLMPPYPGPLVRAVGSPEFLRANLSAEIKIHPIRDGVLIQAGPEPLLGDVNRAEVLPLYREVAKVLRPLFVEEHWPFFGNLIAHDWVHRYHR